MLYSFGLGRLFPDAGSYLQLRPEYRNIVKCNIYPVPTNSVSLFSFL